MEGSQLFIGCANSRGTIETIDFASYGLPIGAGNEECSKLQVNPDCHSDPATTLNIVRRLCVGKSECVINVSSDAFGPKDPCFGVVKILSVRARGTDDCVPARPPPEVSVNKSAQFDFGRNMAGFATLTFSAPHIAAGEAVELRLKHTEIEDSTGEAYNNCIGCIVSLLPFVAVLTLTPADYPGMEFGHASLTCSMTDWYVLLCRQLSTA